jgi:KAP family P-loop domain
MTEEDIWKGDLLGRKEEGKYLQRYIENLYKLDKKDQTSFVLNINSEWGHGKTWFLERFSKQLEVNFPVVYFDAWKNDFTKDPLMSFVSVVCEELANKFAGDKTAVQQVTAIKNAAVKFIKPSLPVILAALAKHYIGLDFDKLGGTKKDKKKLENISDVVSEITQIASSEAMNSFIKEKNAIEEFTATLEALVNKIASGKSKTNLDLPICIIVDELDRCRPTYAIELLETVKHLFSVKGIFFVLATDTKQLAHSIRAVYGQGFNSPAYLKRFFYAEYALADPDYEHIAKYFLDQSPRLYDFLFLPESLHGKYGFNGFFSRISRAFRLTIRDQEHVFKILESIVIASEKKDYHFIFLLFLICLKHKYPEAYIHQSIHKNSTQIAEFFKSESTDVGFHKEHLESLFWNGVSDKHEKYTVQTIIEYYFVLLTEDINRPGFNKDIGFDWQTEIISNLTRKTLSDGSIGNDSGIHDLPLYFNFLYQAGKGKILPILE